MSTVRKSCSKNIRLREWRGLWAKMLVKSELVFQVALDSGVSVMNSEDKCRSAPLGSSFRAGACGEAAGHEDVRVECGMPAATPTDLSTSR